MSQYINKLFENVPTEYVRVHLPALIKNLRGEKGLSHLDIAHLLGCMPDVPKKIEEGINVSYGAKIVASALVMFRMEGKAVVLSPYKNPKHVIAMYSEFYRQFAHGDGKLHHVGPNGSEYETFDV